MNLLFIIEAYFQCLDFSWIGEGVAFIPPLEIFNLCFWRWGVDSLPRWPSLVPSHLVRACYSTGITSIRKCSLPLLFDLNWPGNLLRTSECSKSEATPIWGFAFKNLGASPHPLGSYSVRHPPPQSPPRYEEDHARYVKRPY